MKFSQIDFDQVIAMGREAFVNGLKLQDCPYYCDGHAYNCWVDGWRQEYSKTKTNCDSEDYPDPDDFYLRYGWIKMDLVEAEYQGRTVTLNKPMSNTDGGKRFKVYVKDGDRVKKVTFGSPKGSKLRIRTSKSARKSFAARHNCDSAKDKTTAKYWSCRNKGGSGKGPW